MLVPWRVPSGMSFLAVEYAVTSTIQQTRIYCSNIHIYIYRIYKIYLLWGCYSVDRKSQFKWYVYQNAKTETGPKKHLL